MDLERRAVVKLENLADKKAHRMPAEVRGEVPDPDPVVAVARARSQPLTGGRDLARDPRCVGDALPLRIVEERERRQGAAVRRKDFRAETRPHVGDHGPGGGFLPQMHQVLVGVRLVGIDEQRREQFGRSLLERAVFFEHPPEVQVKVAAMRRARQRRSPRPKRRCPIPHGFARKAEVYRSLVQVGLKQQRFLIGDCSALGVSQLHEQHAEIEPCGAGLPGGRISPDPSLVQDCGLIIRQAVRQLNQLEGADGRHRLDETRVRCSARVIWWGHEAVIGHGRVALIFVRLQHHEPRRILVGRNSQRTRLSNGKWRSQRQPDQAWRVVLIGLFFLPPRLIRR